MSHKISGLLFNLIEENRSEFIVKTHNQLVFSCVQDEDLYVISVNCVGINCPINRKSC